MSDHRPEITLSIVSHAQGNLVAQLLADLRQLTDVAHEIVVTLNRPEDEAFLADAAGMPLRVIRNVQPKGFGANHNAAFAVSKGKCFAIVNPDIRLPRPRLRTLLERLMLERVGACGPVVTNPAGELEDNARRFPTLGQMAWRVTTGRRLSDYQARDLPIDVDWLAGMFVVYRREAFAEVAGFDERYFMYFEDADICRRLRRCGWKVLLDPSTRVVHAARRSSHRDSQYLRWHLRSALRFFCGL